MSEVRYELTDAHKKRLQHFALINATTRELAEMIMVMTPCCRQQALALTDLEQVRMWANSAIAVHECMERNEGECR